MVLVVFADEGKSLNSITQNPWFAISGWIIAVVSIIITIVLYKRSQRDKKPYYCTLSTNVFQGLTKHIPDLTVHFSGYTQPIPCLTITKLIFWNAGKATIEKNDVAKSDPLNIICTDGVLILKADIIKASGPPNCFSETVAQDRKRVSVSFDHIDHGEGVEILLFHTGATGRDIKLSVCVRRTAFLTAVVQCLPKGGHHHGPRQTTRSAQRATLATLDPTLEEQRSNGSSFLRPPSPHTTQLLHLAA